MRKLLILIGLALLSVVIAVPAATVLAQGDPWTCTYDFADGPGGFVSWFDAEWTAGKWQSSPAADPDSFIIALTFGAATDVNSIHVTGFVGDERLDSDYEMYFGDGTPFTNIQNYDLTDTTGIAFDETDTTLRAAVSGVWFGITTADPITESYYDFIELEGEGPSPCETAAYVRPLDASHLDQLVSNPTTTGVSDADDTVFATSVAPGASVFAAADGVITEMRILDPETDCDVNFNRADFIGFSFPCMLTVPGDSTVYFPDGGRPETTGANVWLVRLFADDGREFTYFVEAADYYLTEGQTVAAGCIMGKTFHVEDGQTPPVYADEPGLTIVAVRESGTIIEALDLFTVEPDESAACNLDPENANCMGDVQLNDPAEWESSSGVIWNEPGYTLLGGFDAHLRTSMNLDPAQQPELIVRLRATGGGNGNVTLTLGQTTTGFSVAEGSFQDVTIAGAEHLPDGTFYTIRVLNDGTSNIDVQSVCVRFTDDGEGGEIDNPDPPPPPCIFANNSFNDGTTGWFVTSTEPGPGELRVASGGTFYQNVTVPAGTYDLTVVAAIWSYNSFVPDDEDTDDVDIEYDFGAGSVLLDSHTYGDFAQNNNVAVFTAPLVVATDTTDDFLFEVTLNSPATGVRGLAIRSVCIGTEGTGEGGGDEDGGLFEPNCDGAIATPSGNDIGAWISWHWSQSNKFFRCELIILLNEMYRFFQKSWITTTWSIRWSQAAVVKTVNWFGRDFVGWLGGHLSNIAIGQVTTINTAEECGNLFCLLQSFVTGLGDVLTGILDIMQQLVDPDSPFWEIVSDIFNDTFDIIELALNRLFDLLQSIVGLVAYVVETIGDVLRGLINLVILIVVRILEIFGIVVNAMVMIVTAWINAAPIESDILPSCSMDQTSFRCVILYISERTWYTEAGVIFMPTIAAGMYLALILWVIRRLTNALKDVGVLS